MYPSTSTPTLLSLFALRDGCFDAGAAAAASIAAAGIGLHGGSLIRGAWALLAEVTAHLSESADWTFLQGQWAALTALEVRLSGHGGRVRVYCACVHAWACVPC